MKRRHFRRPDHSIPELNMASLPDLIFTPILLICVCSAVIAIAKFRR